MLYKLLAYNHYTTIVKRESVIVNDTLFNCCMPKLF